MKTKRLTGKPTVTEIHLIWLMILGLPASKTVPKADIPVIKGQYGFQWDEASQSYTAPEEDVYAKLVENYGERATRHGTTYGELRHRAYERL